MNRILVFCLGVVVGIGVSSAIWNPVPPYATPRSAQLVPVPPAALTGVPHDPGAGPLMRDEADSMVSLVAAPLIVTGQATWYGTGPGAGHAAAGSELRTGNWRGRHVEVRLSDYKGPCDLKKAPCVRVVLDDWCACGGARIIDLSDEDFARLAPLSAGVITVTVTAGAGGHPPDRPAPTAPPTDVGP